MFLMFMNSNNRSQRFTNKYAQSITGYIKSNCVDSVKFIKDLTFISLNSVYIEIPGIRTNIRMQILYDINLYNRDICINNLQTCFCLLTDSKHIGYVKISKKLKTIHVFHIYIYTRLFCSSVEGGWCESIVRRPCTCFIHSFYRSFGKLFDYKLYIIFYRSKLSKS